MMLSAILKQRSLLAQLPVFSFSNQPTRQSDQLHQQYSYSHAESCRPIHGITSNLWAKKRVNLPKLLFPKQLGI